LIIVTAPTRKRSLCPVSPPLLNHSNDTSGEKKMEGVRVPQTRKRRIDPMLKVRKEEKGK